MSDTPRALASRLEEASGGSRELDREIFVALEPEKASQRCYAGELEGNVAAYMAPHYTVSLDAALALVERKGLDARSILVRGASLAEQWARERGGTFVYHLPRAVCHEMLTDLAKLEAAND